MITPLTNGVVYSVLTLTISVSYQNPAMRMYFLKNNLLETEPVKDYIKTQI